MASLKSQQQLFGESISEPESLELDYDMWQGQFDFIGPTSSANGTTTGIKINSSSTPVKDSTDDCNLNLVFESLKDQGTRAPILIDEETFLSLHPNDFIDPECGADGPHSGLFIESLSGRKNKRIDNYFNANLQKQKILFMNDKNVSDSLEREKPESEVEASGDDEEVGKESSRRGSSNYDLNNNNHGRNLFDNRLIIRNKCDTLNDQVSEQKSVNGERDYEGYKRDTRQLN